jgi:hypothetical protein
MCNDNLVHFLPNETLRVTMIAALPYQNAFTMLHTLQECISVLQWPRGLLSVLNLTVLRRVGIAHKLFTMEPSYIAISSSSLHRIIHSILRQEGWCFMPSNVH